jgi:hypothetical protein
MWHMHALLLWLVAGDNWTGRGASENFLLLLDKCAAATPVAGAAIVGATALNAEALTDLGSLHHGVAKLGFKISQKNPPQKKRCLAACDEAAR